jgi:hypothetical protein
MSTTLTYGQKIPDAGDRGVPLFQDLEDNFTRLDSHNHDGVNSPLLTAQAFIGVAQTILAANWVTYGGPIGHYRQLVSMSPGFLFNTTKIGFRTSAGQYIYPTVERVSNTSYYLYSTDNTIDFIAIYGG